MADLGPSCRWPSRIAMVAMHTSPAAAPGQCSSGGLNVYVREVCAELGRRGVATDVFTRCPEGESERTESLAPLSRLVYRAVGPRGLDKYRLVHEVARFTELVAEFAAGQRYDLLYSHYWLSGLAACALRSRLGLPWAHRAHTLAVTKNRRLAPGAQPEPEIRIDLEGEISRCADLLVVSTEAERDELRSAYRIRPDRLTVVPPGVDLDHFRPVPRSEAGRRIGRTPAGLFVFAGRLEPLKGVDLVIRALALLAPRYPAARLLVLGDDGGEGRERERLQRLAGELGLTGRVEFWGAVSREVLPACYSAAEACLVPSYSESFGLAALEAQACGTPTIASDTAGLASIVRDGATGFLVRHQDPRAYAASMERLLATPGLAEQMGERARRLASAFTWTRTVDLLLQRFRDLASSARPAPLLA
jgi:D-inositol-3-phosphate glycosyltransferase